MKLDFKKIHKIRKERGFSVSGLCNLVGISRTTLWKWEHKSLSPTEGLARKLSDILNVPISNISDIKESVPVSGSNLSDIVDSWITLTDVNDERYRSGINNALKVIKDLDNTLNQTVFIIRALLDSVEAMFYIKDSNMKYITANSVFLKSVSFDPKISVKGKDDFTFFSQQEARENTDQDRSVLETGKPIISQEGLIPGCRKKKWGLISKFPAFDNDQKIIGLVGTFVDITDRKKSEETRELLEKILDTVPIVINIFDHEAKKVIYGNKEADRVFKEQRKFYSKKTVLNNFNELMQTLRNKNTEFPSRNIFEFKKLNDESTWREDICSAMDYQNEKYFLRIERDYTDMKKVQVENELYREMFNEFSLEDNVITWAIMYEGINKYQVCYLSDEFEKLTGYPKSNFINEQRLLESYVNIDFCIPDLKYKKSILSIIHPKYQRILDKTIRRGKIPQQFIFKLITADKRILVISSSVFKKEIEGVNTVYFEKAEIAKIISYIEVLKNSDMDNDELEIKIAKAKNEIKALKRQFAINRVEKYPNDMQLRYALAVVFWENGELDDAIEQFQLAKNNLNKQILSLLYLGKCFMQKGQYDIAVDQFIKVMDEPRKTTEQEFDALYNLGLAYEKLNSPDDAAKCFKKIYSAKSTYKDVAEILKKYY